MNVLMVGVDNKRPGGMWTVAESFINDKWFNKTVNLYYVPTSTGGSMIKRIKKMIEGYIRILFVLRTNSIDIVHIHMAEKGSVYRKGIVIWLAKRFKIKVIIQMHAGPIVSWYNTLSSKRRQYVSKIMNSADCLLVLGEYWKKQLSVIVPSDKIDVLYNGSECPKNNPYNPDGKYILYMGLLKKTKGIFDLIDAIKIVENKLPSELKVYLCGVDESNQTIKYIEKQGLQERIKLLGWIDKNTRLDLFQNTQMCVLPSYFEALSMTVIEAMCYGIPMVTTNISTMPELLGNDCELIEPGDVHGLAELILKLCSDRELRIKISRLEFSRAKEKFTINNIMQNAVNIYRKILG